MSWREPDGSGDGEVEDGEAEGEGDGAADEDSDDDEYIASRALRISGHRQNGGVTSDVVVTGASSTIGGGGGVQQPQRLVARLPEWVGSRSDCPDGKECARQRDIAHAKECM